MIRKVTTGAASLLYHLFPDTPLVPPPPPAEAATATALLAQPGQEWRVSWTKMSQSQQQKRRQSGHLKTEESRGPENDLEQAKQREEEAVAAKDSRGVCENNSKRKHAIEKVIFSCFSFSEYLFEGWQGKQVVV